MATPALRFRANCAPAFPLVAAGAIAAAAGFYHGRAEAVALGLVLLGGPALVYALLRSSVRGIRVRIEQPASAFEGDSVEVSVSLENRSRLPVFFPVVSDVFTPEIHAQKDVVFPLRVLPGETVVRTYEGSCTLPRGVHTLGSTALSVSDPFGWFQLRRRLSARRELKVYPVVQRFGVDEKLGECLSHLVSDLTHRGAGESTEFWTVREYRPGDPLRRVHWPLTAHRGEPVVREFARNAVGDLSIFLDTDRTSLVGVGRGSSFEHSIKIASALAASAIRRGHRVQVVASERTEDRVPLATGAEQFERILDLLVRIRPTGDVHLARILSHGATEVRSGSSVITMLSPAVHDDPDVERQLLRWRRKGVRVMAVVFDAASFRPVWEGQRVEESSARFAARLRGLGIRAWVIPCAADLRAVFAGGPRR